MKGSEGSKDLTSERASSPLKPGMLWSEMTMSHSRAASADRSAGPLSTRVTSGSKPWRWSSIFSSRASSSESSTIRTLTGRVMAVLLCHRAVLAVLRLAGKFEARLARYDADGSRSSQCGEQDQYHFEA